MAFSTIQKLSLEEALPLNDNPQNRSLVGVFEEDTKLLKNYVKRLYECAQHLITAQVSLTNAASNLSEHLKLYELQKFPLDPDEESVLNSTVSQFSKVIDDLSSSYQVVCSQLQDGMLFPISKFLDADINEIDSLSGSYHSSLSHHDQVMVKYSKISKKRDTDKHKQELGQEYYASSKKVHQVSLNYFAQMNALQYKRKVAIIEPMLAFVHAYRSHFSIGHNTLNAQHTNDFLSNIAASVQGVYTDLGEATQKTVKEIETLEEHSDILYYAEPPKSIGVLPPNTTMTQKAGYLFLRSKFAGMVIKWDRAYVFTQNGKLMHISHGEVGGSCIMALDFHVTAQHVDNEDRRFVFQILNGKKSVILQALSEKDRDEWIATIRNIVKEEGFQKQKTPVDRRNSSFVKASGSSDAIAVPVRSHSSSFSEHLSVAKSGPPPTPPCSPMDGLSLENPIQFDLLGPNDDEIDSLSSTSDSDVRVNPFDELHRNGSSANGNDDDSAAYTVRLLGSTAVRIDRGDRMIYDTMRQVLAARAIYNVFKMTESKLVLSTSSLRLLDPTSHGTKICFAMHDVSYWAAHKENNRLFGFIVRTKSGSQSSFSCYIFESDVSGEEICSSFARITQSAIQKIIEQKAKRNDDTDQESTTSGDVAEETTVVAEVNIPEEKP